ncbi:related to Retrovirus-related POL polyprotein [Melanopsichium pennsylvanicum]|uniref:Related to Retrovirus-related POL polyprotein n=1 Tax=Melanopsichium pennsylvanicum TaxID=63383 RepID=A0AAJ4XLT0_9BASI|nr:related to Retrovirus-related POL polyprotein [Melanopsichium pennsylvanicum]
MAKNRLLGEKPTRWFFSRCMTSTLSNVKALQNGQTGALEEDPKNLPNIAAEFYELLFAKKSTNPSIGRKFIDLMPKIPVILRGPLQGPITSTEVRAGIRGAATGKSPGPDGLPIELFKHVLKSCPENAEILCNSLATFFNSLLEGNRAGEHFSIGVLSILYKNKGSPSELKNYRPLTVTNSDYKLFTSILAKRLCVALSEVVGPHQYAFLPGRLIDDNICLVQSVIDEYKNPEKGGTYLLFIDQEKAYDRVDHKFLWRLLKHVGVPQQIRRAIKMLYTDIRLRVMINGYSSATFPVLSGVRQGDPLSCILYVLFLEPLIRQINASDITGVPLPNGEAIKAVCYADDTVLILKNQAEVDIALKILKDFCEATGAKINWNKSSVLQVGNPPPINIPEVSYVSPENPYLHLGVPMGTDINAQVQTIWDDMKLNMENIASRWSKAHLSLKGRVLIANSLMYSLPRYHLKFVPISSQMINTFVKIYYDFIWDQKSHQKLNDLHAILPTEKGGIGSVDLHSVIDVLCVELVAKLESRIDLPWVQIQRRLLARLHTRTQGEILSVITKPWVQRVLSRPLKESELPSCIQHFWHKWIRIFQNSANNIILQPPASKDDVLAINFWYHPELKILPGQGARRFSNATFRFLAEAGITKIGDIWDPDSAQVKIPNNMPQTRRQAMKAAVTNLLRDLPLSWQNMLNTTPLGHTTEFSDEICIRLRKPNGEFWLTPIWKTSFKAIYRRMIDLKTEGISYDHQIVPLLQIYNAHTGKKGDTKMIWRSARNNFLTPKQGNLLWRFLRQKVLVGQDLHWLDREDQECPSCHVLSSVEHLWISCPTAQQIWDLVRTTWE